MKFLDLEKQYRALQPALLEALKRVLESGEFILGKEVQAFEEAISRYLDIPHIISVNSGTDALLLALRAFGVKEGDEIITTSFTFIATVEVIVALGAKPVFVDIEPSTFNLDPTLLEKAMTQKTKGIIPVHLFGHPAEISSIMAFARSHHLFVIEDACQAIGSFYAGKKIGSIGDIGCFSFFPTKNLGGYGDGGLMATNDEALGAKLRLLRNHGSSPSNKYLNILLGTNSRLDALQAAILNVKLPYLDEWNEKRRFVAERYSTALQGVGDVITPITKPNATHVFHQYTIRTKHRDALRDYLKNHGIPVMVYYPIPLHLQPIFQSSEFQQETEKASREVLSLPIYPELSEEEQDLIIANIKTFFTTL